MIIHLCNPSTQEAKAEWSWIWGQPGLHGQTLSQTNKPTLHFTRFHPSKRFSLICIKCCVLWMLCTLNKISWRGYSSATKIRIRHIMHRACLLTGSPSCGLWPVASEDCSSATLPQQYCLFGSSGKTIQKHFSV
jgi:hypothetical protein